jgi:hypothetical protein
MRRAVTSLAAVLVLSLLLVAPAAAAEPIYSEDHDPGVYCDFASRLEVLRDEFREWSETRKDGTVVTVLVGRSTLRVTNLDKPSHRRIVSGPYVFTLLERPDGSVRADLVGAGVGYYAEGDPTNLGQGLWALRGHATESYDADGNLVSARFRGHSADLCAALG